jgi:hypothetical protein
MMIYCSCTLSDAVFIFSIQGAFYELVPSGLGRLKPRCRLGKQVSAFGSCSVTLCSTLQFVHYSVSDLRRLKRAGCVSDAPCVGRTCPQFFLKYTAHSENFCHLIHCKIVQIVGVGTSTVHAIYKNTNRYLISNLFYLEQRGIMKLYSALKTFSLSKVPHTGC